MKKVIVMTTFAVATLTAVSCGKKENAETTVEQTAPNHNDGDKKQLAYACPMDCENGKIYDAPGKCPVCEMDMEVVTEGNQH